MCCRPYPLVVEDRVCPTKSAHEVEGLFSLQSPSPTSVNSIKTFSLACAFGHLACIHCLCTVCAVPTEAGRVSDLLDLEVQIESRCVGAGNWTQDLCESSQCSELPSHLSSSPTWRFSKDPEHSCGELCWVLRRELAPIFRGPAVQGARRKHKYPSSEREETGQGAK